MNGVAKLEGWLHLPLNPLKMQKLTENYVVCNGKIKRALGVERMPVGAREGLLETLRGRGSKESLHSRLRATKDGENLSLLSVMLHGVSDRGY